MQLNDLFEQDKRLENIAAGLRQYAEDQNNAMKDIDPEGSMDYEFFMEIADYIESGNAEVIANLLDDADTEPRDYVMDLLVNGAPELAKAVAASTSGTLQSIFKRTGRMESTMTEQDIEFGPPTGRQQFPAGYASDARMIMYIVTDLLPRVRDDELARDVMNALDAIDNNRATKADINKVLSVFKAAKEQGLTKPYMDAVGKFDDTPEDDDEVDEATGTSLRPRPRPTNIGATGGDPMTGEPITRGIDPEDNYSPEDLARLTGQQPSSSAPATSPRPKMRPSGLGEEVVAEDAKGYVEYTINNALETVEKLERMFGNNNQLEKAVTEIGGDIAWFTDVRENLKALFTNIEELQYSALAHMEYGEQEDDDPVEEAFGNPEPTPSKHGYPANIDSLQAVKRRIESGRLDIADALVNSMIGKLMHDENNPDMDESAGRLSTTRQDGVSTTTSSTGRLRTTIDPDGKMTIEPAPAKKKAANEGAADDYIVAHAKQRMQGLAPEGREAFLANLEKSYPGIRKRIGEGWDDEDEGGASIEDIKDAIIRRMNANTDLMLKALEAAGNDPTKVLDAIEDVASFHEGADELGSSDISGMVRQVMQQLGVTEASNEDTIQRTMWEAVKRGIITMEQLEDPRVRAIVEKKLTKAETKERERIVKGMKKSKKGFKKSYGDDAEAVMYATATKLAKKNA